MEPLLGIGSGVSLETELGGTGKLAAQSTTLVLATNVKLVFARNANGSIGEEERELGLGILAVVVAILELVEESGRGNNVVTSGPAKGQLVSGLALQSAFNKSLGGRMVFVGKGNVINGASRLLGVNKNVAAAADKVDPFKLLGDTLNRAEHVVVESGNLLALAAAELGKGLHGLLESVNNVALKHLEVVLDRDEIVAVVVLGNDLVAEAVDNTTADNVRVVGTRKLATSRVKGSSLLAEELNLLLGGVAKLLNLLGASTSTALELLGLVLDLLVEALKDGKDGALDALFSLDARVDHSLCVGAHILKESGDTANVLIEVVALAKRVGDGL